MNAALLHRPNSGVENSNPPTVGCGQWNRWRRRERGAFTLVETLAATGIGLLMLTLFLTIFQMATQAMTIQKGMSANDQKARLVQMILRNDLNGDKFDSADPSRPKACRTFRNVLPFSAGENGQPHFDSTDRCGYFYISENDPNN